jgi:4-diphosphocytidyl-2-C-methyl-D-erythritol kinase
VFIRVHSWLGLGFVVTVFSPAKINLFLAVTGQRADGYHDLVSVAAPLDFGDELAAESRPQARDPGPKFTLECDQPEVPLDGSNLILMAAEAFAAATAWKQKVHFKLTKRIPLGAGLGGGSSNAVAALRAMNQLAGGLLPEAKLAGVAAALGSDCALFLAGAPVIMRGRGERVEQMPAVVAKRLRGRRVLLLKPGFGISTSWAYGRMAACAGVVAADAAVYLPAELAEQKLARWILGEAPAEELLFNNMEGVAFDKFVALPVLLGKLRAKFGVTARMSGSGSACFVLPGELAMGPADIVTQMKHLIGECWGAAAFVQEARLL